MAKIKINKINNKINKINNNKINNKKSIIKSFAILLMLAIVMLLITSIITAADITAAENLTEEVENGRKLIESAVPCSQLDNGELEMIGEYYMEQMHPGEAHEAMHAMMFSNNKEAGESMHIFMAKKGYCGESTTMMPMGATGGMMNMGNMGMMNSMSGNTMMGYSAGFWLWNIIWYLFWLGVIALIIWIVYKLINNNNSANANSANANPNYLKTLKNRYASGELTKKQYEEMKKELRK
jgi:uncharacterized membrane protein